MTRNQKIALGCGGAGCLGLIVVTIAACLIYYFYSRQMSRYEATRREYNLNFNLNSNSNSNGDSNDNSNSNSSSSTSALSLSDDDKHRLYYAATATHDTDLVHRVSIAIGIMNDDLTIKDGYQRFMADHAVWALRNLDFIGQISSEEKAKAYVDEHLE